MPNTFCRPLLSSQWQAVQRWETPYPNGISRDMDGQEFWITIVQGLSTTAASWLIENSRPYWQKKIKGSHLLQWGCIVVLLEGRATRGWYFWSYMCSYVCYYLIGYSLKIFCFLFKSATEVRRRRREERKEKITNLVENIKKNVKREEDAKVWKSRLKKTLIVITVCSVAYITFRYFTSGWQQFMHCSFPSRCHCTYCVKQGHKSFRARFKEFLVVPFHRELSQIVFLRYLVQSLDHSPVQFFNCNLIQIQFLAYSSVYINLYCTDTQVSLKRNI